MSGFPCNPFARNDVRSPKLRYNRNSSRKGKGRVSWAEEEVKGGNGREEWKEGKERKGRKDGREGREGRMEGKGGRGGKGRARCLKTTPIQRNFSGEWTRGG